MTCFFSYARVDEPLRDALAKHLSLLENQGVIASWHDRLIPPGTEWAEAINAHLESAQIILLLVSADFMASKYCYGIEMERAMARHDTDDARVMPIILRAVDWRCAPFGKLQALPTDGRPITSWPNQDEAFRDVACGIRKVAGELSRGKVGPASPETLSSLVSPLDPWARRNKNYILPTMFLLILCIITLHGEGQIWMKLIFRRYWNLLIIF